MFAFFCFDSDSSFLIDFVPELEKMCYMSAGNDDMDAPNTL